VEKKKPKGDQVLYTLSVLPAAIPGTVMGLGYILAFNKPYFSSTGRLDRHHQYHHLQDIGYQSMPSLYRVRS
jgi:ABC-type Fe3+ transport system permease subunit